MCYRTDSFAMFSVQIPGFVASVHRYAAVWSTSHMAPQSDWQGIRNTLSFIAECFLARPRSLSNRNDLVHDYFTRVLASVLPVSWPCQAHQTLHISAIDKVSVQIFLGGWGGGGTKQSRTCPYRFARGIPSYPGNLLVRSLL